MWVPSWVELLSIFQHFIVCYTMWRNNVDNILDKYLFRKIRCFMW